MPEDQIIEELEQEGLGEETEAAPLAPDELLEAAAGGDEGEETTTPETPAPFEERAAATLEKIKETDPELHELMMGLLEKATPEEVKAEAPEAAAAILPDAEAEEQASEQNAFVQRVFDINQAVQACGEKRQAIRAELSELQNDYAAAVEEAGEKSVGARLAARNYAEKYKEWEKVGEELGRHQKDIQLAQRLDALFRHAPALSAYPLQYVWLLNNGYLQTTDPINKQIEVLNRHLTQYGRKPVGRGAPKANGNGAAAAGKTLKERIAALKSRTVKPGGRAAARNPMGGKPTGGRANGNRIPGVNYKDMSPEERREMERDD